MYIHVHVYPNTAKHQGTCVNHRFINQRIIQNLSLTQTTRKQFIRLENEDRKVGEATDIYKGFVFPEIY